MILLIAQILRVHGKRHMLQGPISTLWKLTQRWERFLNSAFCSSAIYQAYEKDRPFQQAVLFCGSSIKVQSLRATFSGLERPVWRQQQA
jgi:hypothetical protein